MAEIFRRFTHACSSQNIILAGAFVSGSIFLYYMLIAAYNLFLHPLRKFPGPKLAAATPFYINSLDTRGIKHLKVEEFHAKYGEIVRIAPNILSVIGETAWKDIYMHKQGRPQFRKFDLTEPIRGAYSIISAPDDIHARQRKMLSHAFSDRALREQEGILNTYINLLMANLHEDAQKGEAVDMVANFNFTTFDIIGDLSLGQSFQNLELRRPHPWLTTVFAAFRVSVKLNVMLLIPGVRTVINLFAKFFIAERVKLVEHAVDKVRQRIERKTDRPDFMSKVLPHKREDGTGISRAEIEATTVVLIVAGSETTATLLSGCLYHLLKNRVVLEKLKAEIRGTFKSVDEIDLLKVGHLTYLMAVLEESLRLYPPVPVSLPRVIPPEGASVCGYWIPGKTVIGVPQRTAYRSPTNFVEPSSFIPERWLPNRDRKFEKDRRDVCQPFSAGPRNCLGKNLAYAEMKLILTRFIYEFDFEMVDKDFKWDDQKVYGLFEKPPLMVWIKERQ